MKLKALLISALILVGCDKEVSRDWASSRIEEQAVNCTMASFCVTCLPGFDGKVGCGAKLSPYCPGRQRASVKITPFTAHFKSGKVEHGEDTDIQQLLTECK